MEQPSFIPTREQVRLELAGRLLADALRLISLYGIAPVGAMLGQKKIPAVGFVGPTPESISSGSDWEPTLRDINVDQLPIGQFAMAMYDYAFEARLPIGMSPSLVAAELESLEDFVVHFHSERVDLFMRDPVMMGNAGSAGWRALPSLYHHAHARASLDRGEDLTLDQLALLARMSARSVRNAIHGEGEQRLDADGEFVDNDEARRWLCGRREFTATIAISVTEQPGEHPDKLATLSDLGRFLNERWNGLGKSDADVCAELGWPKSREEYLRIIPANPHLIDPRDCNGLAHSLAVSVRWFTEQVMRLKFPDQMDLLIDDHRAMLSPVVPLQRTPQSIADSAQRELGAGRVCTRLLFELTDGTKVFPIRMKRQDTNTVAFRLSKGGAGGNTLEAGVEVEDEQRMIDMVVKEGYAVRMGAEKGGAKSLYKLDGRAVRVAFLDGQLL